MDTLYDRELEQLRAALAATRQQNGRKALCAYPGDEHGEHDHDACEDAATQDVAAWVERACAALPEGHPLKLRRQ